MDENNCTVLQRPHSLTHDIKVENLAWFQNITNAAIELRDTQPNENNTYKVDLRQNMDHIETYVICTTKNKLYF